MKQHQVKWLPVTTCEPTIDKSTSQPRLPRQWKRGSEREAVKEEKIKTKRSMIRPVAVVIINDSFTRQKMTGHKANDASSGEKRDQMLLEWPTDGQTR